MYLTTLYKTSSQIKYCCILFCTCNRRDGDGDGSARHCYRIEAVMHVIDVMAMVMDIVIGLKL